MELIKVLKTRIDKKGRHISWGLFKCSHCSKEVEKPLNLGKRQKSCGCRKCITRGYDGKKTRLFTIWTNIKQRILNFKSGDYKNYGGRGITICPEWADKNNGFINFRNWALNNGYTDNLEIDRINNDGNYEPNNCRWTISKINQRNKRNNIFNMKIANEIRDLYATGNYTQQQLANNFETSIPQISRVINNKIWGE